MGDVGYCLGSSMPGVRPSSNRGRPQRLGRGRAKRNWGRLLGGSGAPTGAPVYRLSAGGWLRLRRLVFLVFVLGFGSGFGVGLGVDFGVGFLVLVLLFFCVLCFFNSSKFDSFS